MPRDTSTEAPVRCSVAFGVFASIASRPPRFRQRLRQHSIRFDTVDHQGEILVPRRRSAVLVPGDAVSGHDHLPDAWRGLVEKDILDVVEPIRCPTCARDIRVEEAVIAVKGVSI